MHRAKTVLSHLAPSPLQHHEAAAPILSDRDVVIVSAKRTPIARAKKGGYNGVPTDHLLSTAIKGVIAESKIDPKLIGDVVVGNVLGDQSAFMARVGSLLAGLPETVPAWYVVAAAVVCAFDNIC